MRCGSSGVRRAVGAVVVALVAATGAAGTAAALPGPDEDAAERAAQEISAARDRANEAAAELAEAQSEFDVLTDRGAELAAQQAALEQEVHTLRAQVAQVAVNRFVSSGSVGIPILTGYRRPSEQLQTEALISVVTQSSADAMDLYEEARSELAATQEEVAANQDALTRAQEKFRAAQQRAEEEVVHLQEVETKRLEDERVYLAVLAKQREDERRRQEEEQRQAEARRQEEEEAARVAALAAPTQQDDDDETTNERAARGSAGARRRQLVHFRWRWWIGRWRRRRQFCERFGGGGGGGGGGGISCPVYGASYSDTYGSPRSGGRSHQGVDMIAPTGTPIYAVVSGSVNFKNNSLGGLSVWLSGSDGNSYYYAHLDSFEGSSRSVSQGETIGYVGSSGNAPIPHLHFEVHPGGGAAVNPTPWVRNAGC